MAIPVTCPHCGKHLNAPDNVAGKQVRCAGCKGVLTIPVPSAGSSPTDDFAIPEEEPAPSPAPSVARPAAPPTAATPKPASRAGKPPVSSTRGTPRPLTEATGPAVAGRDEDEETEASPCLACGQETGGAHFCPHCGEALVGATRAGTRPPIAGRARRHTQEGNERAESQDSRNAGGEKKSSLRDQIFGCLALIIGGLFVIGMISKGCSKDTTQSGQSGFSDSPGKSDAGCPESKVRGLSLDELTKDMANEMDIQKTKDGYNCSPKNPNKFVFLITLKGTQEHIENGILLVDISDHPSKTKLGFALILNFLKNVGMPKQEIDSFTEELGQAGPSRQVGSYLVTFCGVRELPFRAMVITLLFKPPKSGTREEKGP